MRVFVYPFHSWMVTAVGFAAVAIVLFFDNPFDGVFQRQLQAPTPNRTPRNARFPAPNPDSMSPISLLNRHA